MKSKQSGRSPLKQTEFLILAALFEEPRHGYGIVQEIEARSEGRVLMRPGDVYRVIYRLRQRGLLDEAARRKVEDGDERRTYYALTETGREVATAEAEMLALISSQLVAGEAKQGSSR